VYVDADVLIAAGADLSPWRYLPVVPVANVDELRAESREAKAAVERASNDLAHALSALEEAPSPTVPTPHDRVRLADVASVFRSRGATEADDHRRPGPGDLLLVANASGFGTRLFGEGEDLPGPHAIVIRPLAGSPASPSWLLTWTRSDEFAGLFDRYARGTTIRSVSAKDLSEFELDVPSPELQTRNAETLARLDVLETARGALDAALRRLRSAEVRLAYAEVTGE
jgi:hypothetical protein